MRRIGVTELKNRLSHYLRLVKQGESIEILERRIPIGRIDPVSGTKVRERDLVERLTRDGIATAPRKKPSRLPPPVPCRGDAVRALREERGER